jgi:hypothetical protein
LPLDNRATPDVQAFQLEGSSPRPSTALNGLLKRKENEKAGGRLFRTEMAAAKKPWTPPRVSKAKFRTNLSLNLVDLGEVYPWKRNERIVWQSPQWKQIRQ